MGQLVEVLVIEVDEDVVEPSPLKANIDSPTAGRRMAATGLEIGGWALAPSGRPNVVEVTLGDEVLARGAWQRRDDLAAAFPGQPEAGAAGFEIAVDVSQAPVEAELEVRAQIEDSPVPFARLRVRRYWRGELAPDRVPLVSIAVVDERSDEDALAGSLASIGSQRHQATEVVVLRTSTAAPSLPAEQEENGIRVVVGGLNGPELRNEAIRQSNGELILFLPAGARLTPDALTLAIEMLTRWPAASAVIDGDHGGVAAALYRRSAFEELEGFGDGGGDCDLELAIRAQRFDALLTPGALVAGGG
jgi:hypothetical protein